MIPEERQKGCESMNLTRISIWRNQVFLGEGLEQRLNWKISETLAVQILELDGECYLLHVIQIMYHSSQARQPKNQTSKKIRKAFFPPQKTWTNSFVATLARSSSTLPVRCLVFACCWEVQMIRTVRLYTVCWVWSVASISTSHLGSKKTLFFLDGRGWCCYRWILVISCWFCVRTQWEKREMNGIEDGDVVSGY